MSVPNQLSQKSFNLFFSYFNLVLALLSLLSSPTFLLDEAVYRWNTRKMSESERFAHMFKKSIGLVCKWSEIEVGLEAA